LYCIPNKREPAKLILFPSYPLLSRIEQFCTNIYYILLASSSCMRIGVISGFYTEYFVIFCGRYVMCWGSTITSRHCQSLKRTKRVILTSRYLREKRHIFSTLKHKPYLKRIVDSFRRTNWLISVRELTNIYSNYLCNT
jgi:hypothetical protein